MGDNLGLGHGKASGGGPDKLRGGKDNDRFQAGPGKDQCKGGTGFNKDISQPKCEEVHAIP